MFIEEVKEELCGMGVSASSEDGGESGRLVTSISQK